MAIRVTVWNEFLHEKDPNHACGKIYPDGIHGAIAKFLATDEEIVVNTATLEEPEHGLSEEVLNNTDVLIWWAHMGHHMVSDEIVNKIQLRVLDGMGFIGLHSAHYSKIFQKLMGTTCSLRWREMEGEHERVWCVNPSHPITEGLPSSFVVPETEMYGETFDIPQPDDLVFISWYRGGEVFRSGICYNRGRGKVFYFAPGHETFPIYYQPEIQKVITNAVKWAAPKDTAPSAITCIHAAEPIEKW